MDSEVVKVVSWVDICVCLPLTIAAFCFICFEIRRDHVLVYSINLLISNLIQLFTVIVWEVNGGVDGASFIIYCSTGMVSLAFRMCIAVERCLVITCPQLHCIRQIKASVPLCVAVWVACIITFPLPLLFDGYLFICTLGILPAFVFIACLAWTLRFLLKTPSDATSVSSGEIKRVIRVLVLLLLNYTVMILPMFISLILAHFNYFSHLNVISSLLLLSPFVDLFLFVFMCERKLQKCLCSCRKENNAADEGRSTPV